jgi:hypothetical protein
VRIADQGGTPKTATSVKTVKLLLLLELLFFQGKIQTSQTQSAPKISKEKSTAIAVDSMIRLYLLLLLQGFSPNSKVPR